jgi:mono/diheme cytochrome c family protein
MTLSRFYPVSIGALTILLLVESASAAPRDAAQRPAPPRQPSATVPQTEPMDLDEGKTPQQMFSTSCVVCHQSPQGLAKGRGAGQLGSFLRQHYTTGTGQANILASYLTSSGLDRGTAAPVRTSVPDRPDKPEKPEPATTSRRPKPDETRGRPEPDVAATHPSRRIRNEDGTTQPVEGLVVLPPGAEQVPDTNAKPERRREPQPTQQRQRQPRPSEIKPAEVKPAETKPAEQPKPAETAKSPEPEVAPAPAVQAEAPRPPRDPAAAHSALTEDRPKPEPSQIQDIPL